MSRHLQTLFLLAVLSFLFVIPTQAQVTTASMSGTVMFQDEPVIGATVLAVHEPSGQIMVRSQTLTDAFPYKVCVQEVHTKLRSLTLVINLPFIPALPSIGRELQLEC